MDHKNYCWMLVLFIIVSISALTGCSNDTSNKTPDEVLPFAERVKTSADFTLSIELPKEIEAGRNFVIEGTLAYKGDKRIELSHASPIIRFFIIDETGEHIDPMLYHDVDVKSLFEPGQIMTVEEIRRINFPGIYKIIPQTPGILLANDPIIIDVK